MGLPLLAALNPLGFVADLIKAHRLDQWARLIVSLIFSGTVSFLSVCGAGLVAHRPSLEAVGFGMLASAAMCLKTWMRSPLTKGVQVALPTEATADADNMDSTVVKH